MNSVRCEWLVGVVYGRKEDTREYWRKVGPKDVCSEGTVGHALAQVNPLCTIFFFFFLF